MMGLCEDDLMVCMKEHVQPFCGGGDAFIICVELSRLREVVKELKNRNRRRLRNKDIDELFGEVFE
jgi:hypothetical protein